MRIFVKLPYRRKVPVRRLKYNSSAKTLYNTALPWQSEFFGKVGINLCDYGYFNFFHGLKGVVLSDGVSDDGVSEEVSDDGVSEVETSDDDEGVSGGGETVDEVFSDEVTVDDVSDDGVTAELLSATEEVSFWELLE